MVFCGDRAALYSRSYTCRLFLAHQALLTCRPVRAGGPESCEAGASFVVASTVPGQQAALASMSEDFVGGLLHSPAGDFHGQPMFHTCS